MLLPSFPFLSLQYGLQTHMHIYISLVFLFIFIYRLYYHSTFLSTSPHLYLYLAWIIFCTSLFYSALLCIRAYSTSCKQKSLSVFRKNGGANTFSFSITFYVNHRLREYVARFSQYNLELALAIVSYRSLKCMHHMLMIH